MLKDIVTIRPKVNFKFGKYLWETNTNYTIHRSFAELFYSNKWLNTHSDGNLDFGFIIDPPAQVRSTEEQFFEFFSIIMESHLSKTKSPHVTLVAHPPKII